MLLEGIFPVVTWQHGANAAAIVGAVATTAAVIWAVLSTLHERRERADIESNYTEERQATREAARRAQAERVVGWFKLEPFGEPRADGEFFMFQPTIYVGNYSDAPIFDIKVVGQNRLNMGNPTVVELGVLPPHTVEETVGDVVSGDVRPDVSVSVKFRDVAAIRWERLSSGQLQELDQSST